MDTRKTVRLAIGVIIIGAAAGYLLYKAMDGSWVYYYSVDEFLSGPFLQGNVQGGEGGVIRLAGKVKTGTIVRDVEKGQIDFELGGQKGTIPVRYYGAAPKNFIDDKEVVAEGKMSSDGIFKAEKLLTRCESKYKAKLHIELDAKPESVEEEPNNRDNNN